MNFGHRQSALGQVLGLTLAVCGAGMVVSALVDILYGQSDDWQVLVGTGLVAAGCGYVLRVVTAVPDRIPRLDIFFAVTGAWSVMSVVGAVPYLATGTLTSFEDALFESVSGFTTTGATVLQAADDPTTFAASHGILFWRSMTQWLGGMGVIVLVVAVLPSAGNWGMSLFQAEAPGPTGERLTPKVRSTARHLWGVYAVFTIVVTVCFLVTGMDAYDAVSHAFTTVSTGGFSRHTLSIAHFDSAAIEWVTIVAMFTAGTSFVLLYRLIRGRPGPLIRSVEFRTYALIVAVASVVTFLAASPDRSVESFRGAVFTVVSITSTTGYGTVDFVGEWSPAAQSVVLVLMPLGAMAGSTSGGVKLIRVLAVASLAHREALSQIHEHLVRPIRVGGTVVSDRVANKVIGFLILALAAFGGGGLLIALTGEDVLTAFSASASMIGNVGPGLGDVGPRSDFAGLTGFAKLVCIANMMLGRLEIYPVLLALAKVPVPGLRPLMARTFRSRD